MAERKYVGHKIRRQEIIPLVKISGVKKTPEKTAKIITFHLFEIKPGIYDGFIEGDIPYAIAKAFPEKELQDILLQVQSWSKWKYPKRLLKQKITLHEKYLQLLDKYEEKQRKAKQNGTKRKNRVSQGPGNEQSAGPGSAPPASCQN